MTKHLITTLIAAVAIAASAGILPAQRQVSVAADVGWGFGSGSGGDYRDPVIGGPKLAVSARWLDARRAGWFAELGLDMLAVGNGVSDCSLPCQPDFPNMTGLTITGGAIARARVADVRVGLGGGGYDAGNSTAGALVAQLDAAPRFGWRIAPAVGYRFVTFRLRGDAVRTHALVIGIRAR